MAKSGIKSGFILLLVIVAGSVPTVVAQQIQDLYLECVKPVYILADDFNRDSYPDLALACHSCNTVVVLPNLGRVGTPCAQFDSAYSWKLEDSPTALASGYFLDPPSGQNFPYFSVFPNIVAVTQYQPGLVRFSPLDPRGEFLSFRDSPNPVEVNTISSFATLTHVLAVDLTNDGALEVVVLDGLTPMIGVYQGDRSGLNPAVPGSSGGTSVAEVASLVFPISAYRAYYMATGDFDRDGYLDLVVAADGKIMFFRNEFAPGGTLRLAPPAQDIFPQATPEIVVGTKVVGLAVADFDRDGYLDVAAVDPDFGALSILINQGGCWEFHMVARIKMEGEPVFIVPIDCDRNSLVDLAIAERATDQVTIVLNKLEALQEGSRPDPCGRTVPSPEKFDVTQFFVAFSFAVGPQPVGLAVADFDRNGIYDIAVALNGGGPPGTVSAAQVIYNPCCCNICGVNTPCCGEAESELERCPEEIGGAPKG